MVLEGHPFPHVPKGGSSALFEARYPCRVGGGRARRLPRGREVVPYSELPDGVAAARGRNDELGG
jgi:hypothetical protein